MIPFCISNGASSCTLTAEAVFTFLSTLTADSLSVTSVTSVTTASSRTDSSPANTLLVSTLERSILVATIPLTSLLVVFFTFFPPFLIFYANDENVQFIILYTSSI